MSDLRFFLWNDQSLVSTKSRDSNKNKKFKLIEWPDFGFVGCPSEYITLSAYLMAQPMSFQQLLKLVNNESLVNHFIYVCKMLNIITESPNNKAVETLKTFKTDLSVKLKSIFF